MMIDDMVAWRDRQGGSTGVAEYDGNPLIRCLPPPPSDKECFRHLMSMPACTDAERRLPPHLREQLVFVRMKQAFLPTGTQMRQAKQIDLLLRAGYVARNPSCGKYQTQLTELALGEQEATVRRRTGSDMVADSMVALGPSGIGKTTVVRRQLDGYPQVVRHDGAETGTLTQIVWLRVETAADGSPKQTILSMFAEIDRLLQTNYSERFGSLPRERLLVKAQQIFAKHAIGLIVVDEIQNLSNSHQGESDLMSFLTSLVNVINVPILMIGTMKALSMMRSCFRTARRGEGNGSIIYEPMPMDNDWETFVKLLFRFQWTRERTEVTPSISAALWEESQGIIDIAVKLFVLSQMRAIRVGTKTGGPEAISRELVETVASDSLKLVRPMLDALRRKDWTALERYEDLGGLDAFVAKELERSYPGAANAPDLDALATAISARIDGGQGEVATALLSAALAANGVDVKDMAAVLEMVARVRASADPVAELAQAEPAETRRRSPRNRKAEPPLGPQDVRSIKSGGDARDALAQAGLLDEV